MPETFKIVALQLWNMKVTVNSNHSWNPSKNPNELEKENLYCSNHSTAETKKNTLKSSGELKKPEDAQSSVKTTCYDFYRWIPTH